jgi:hypothetical protein
MQESGLRNLGDLGVANDHDSLGLFQQRPSQGWGTPAQVMDPAYAARKFYDKLLTIPGWQQLPLTEAAQRVQVSAYPDAYAKHEADARALVNTIAAQLGLAGDCGGPWVNPMPPGSYVLTSPYGRRWGTHHDGQDIAAPTGTPIRPATAGTVRSAECTSPFCDRPGAVDAAGNPVTPGCDPLTAPSRPGILLRGRCPGMACVVLPIKVDPFRVAGLERGVSWQR